jgi:hypothetical protein
MKIYSLGNSLAFTLFKYSNMFEILDQKNISCMISEWFNSVRATL